MDISFKTGEGRFSYRVAGFKVVDTYNKETPMGYGEFIKMEFTDYKLRI